MKSTDEGKGRLAQVIARARTSSGTLPMPVRERAIAYARQRSAAGAAQVEIAEELGLSAMTVYRWLSTPAVGEQRSQQASSPQEPGAQASAPKLRAVRVIDSPRRKRASTSMVVVVSPAGFRVEGLTLADVLTLLRAVG